MKNRNSFSLQDKKIVITGGAGFIGSNLCDYFLQNNNQIVCLDNFSTGFKHNIESFLSNPNFTLLEGDIRNFETCIKLSQGKYVHLIYGDNYLVKDFYVEIESLFEDFPRIGAAFTEFEYINEQGHKIWEHNRLRVIRGVLKNWLLTIAKKQEVQPPAIVIKRSTYEQLGAYYAVEYGEFWEMCARIAAHFEVAYCPRVLSKYRVHGLTISLSVEQSKMNIKDVTKVIDIIRGYLPFENRDEVSNESKKYFSQYYSRLSHKVYHEYNQTNAAVIQAWDALVMDINLVSLRYSFLLFFKVFFGYKYFRNLVVKTA